MTTSHVTAADVWPCSSCAAPLTFRPLPDGSGSFAICEACGDPCVYSAVPLPDTHFQSVAQIIRARVLALIRDETARVPGGGPAWEALLHLRETVEDMEILL